MSSDAGLDDPNHQLDNAEVAPNGSDDGENGGMDDLFGDDPTETAEAEAEPTVQRDLDDEDLDSGDDLGRSDRIQREANEPQPVVVEDNYNVIDVDFPRHPIPQPSDGEVYALKVPKIMSIEPSAFHIQSFQPPTTEHHKTEAPPSDFSALKTAQTTIRWRHSPSNPSELQSNARFLRWSDGSLTLQLASNPTVQYQIQAKPLAFQQRNPPKPTPTSINDGKRGNVKWNEKAESWMYLASASNASFMVRITNKITGKLVVVPADDDKAALQSLARGTEQSKKKEGHVVMMGIVTEDPELAKKRAEQADREKTRAQGRLEGNLLKEKERAVRGGARGPRSGLTIGGLEDDDMGGRGSGRPPRPKPRRKKRNDEYSDEEEELYGRRPGRQDEYDEEDDFIAGSDEEEDKDAEGSEEEEDYDAAMDRREKEQAKAARAGTPKRDRPRDADADEDADHDSPVSRQKRRRVVEEDDDDE
ncbi:hypothetical protein BLS_004060 [Venturia inaequalis]|uniref:Leo1-like protein n=1 Tax=Venturia inaequalis TaxID=5025 RepID=A0A8H3ULN2_VENIN|nr:hypothetical protein BLS_004060 [Venturia inaequalis]